MDDIKILVPCAPWTVNAERGEVHWKHRKRTEEVRKAAKQVCVDEDIKPIGYRVDVFYRPFTRLGGGDPGSHYPTLKAAIDGFVDADVLMGDDKRYVRLVAAWPCKPSTLPGIVVTLVPLEDQPV